MLVCFVDCIIAGIMTGTDFFFQVNKMDCNRKFLTYEFLTDIKTYLKRKTKFEECGSGKMEINKIYNSGKKRDL